MNDSSTDCTFSWRNRWPQPNDKSRKLLRLMSSCHMSFDRVSRLTSHVKPRDGNAMTPSVQVKSNQGCFFSGGRETWDMRREVEDTRHVARPARYIKGHFPPTLRSRGLSPIPWVITHGCVISPRCGSIWFVTVPWVSHPMGYHPCLCYITATRF